MIILQWIVQSVLVIAVIVNLVGIMGGRDLSEKAICLIAFSVSLTAFIITQQLWT